MYDLIIKNGMIIDGTGSAAYRADVAIKSGRIERIASGLTGTQRVLDAAGLVVTPGFIDSHSHADAEMLTLPDQVEKIEQGITTNIGGQCGMSKGPVSCMKTPETAADVPGFGKETDVYRTMGTLLDIASQVPQGSNIATFVGHRALREAVMGPVNRAPTADEMRRMQELLIEGMEHGALGVTFGLIYPPSCYALTDELIAFARTAAEHGGLVAAHIRNESDRVIESVEEFLQILRASGARGVLSHHKSVEKQNWGKVRTTLKMLDDAIAQGVDVYCDVYPYIASSTSLSVKVIPAALHDHGVDGLVEILSDPVRRAQIKEQNLRVIGPDLSWILITNCPAYPQYVGKRMDEVAALHGTDVYDAAFDMIRDCRNAVSACYFTMCEEDVKTVLAYPRAMIGTDSSVAGKRKAYHPRLRGTFPRVLGRYVREAQVTTLEEMIRKMTGLPAQVYGLTEKGRIAEGYDADICIFDAEKIIDRADYAACHLRAEGLKYVLMDGEVVVEDAVYNGKRRGRVLLRKERIYD